MAKLAPIFNDAQLINGIPANGAKLFTYVAGSSTKQATYTDAAGLTAQSNPILLNSRGEPAQPIWLTEGLSYKFVFAPATDSDPPVSPIRTIDNITGINDASLTIDQWVDSGLVPTYVSPTTFTVAGDQTSIFTNKRRLKSLVTAGTAYSTVVSSVFGALTTVTVVNDSTPLDSGLSSVQLGLITPNNTSLPSVIEGYRATVAATATTTPLWTSTAQVQDWTGTPTITTFPNAPQAGTWRVVYPAAGTIFTDNANIDVQGDANYTVETGDKIYIEALTTTTFKVWIEKKTGLPTVNPASVQIPIRQTVLSGTVDTSGLPNFGGSTGSTTVTASTTLVATAANGFVSGTTGAVNNVGSIVNPSWTGLSTNGTMYLYLDIASNGTCTTGSTTLAPTYRWGGADVVTNGQFTFNIQEMVGKVGNGSVATQVYRVFVGQVTVAGSVVTAITWYALMGRYDSGFTNTLPGTSTSVSRNHNIGTNEIKPQLILECLTTDQGYAVGDRILDVYTQPAGTFSPIVKTWTSLTAGFSTSTSAAFSVIPKGGGASGNLTAANWRYKIIAERAW